MYTAEYNRTQRSVIQLKNGNIQKSRGGAGYKDKVGQDINATSASRNEGPPKAAVTNKALTDTAIPGPQATSAGGRPTFDVGPMSARHRLTCVLSGHIRIHINFKNQTNSKVYNYLFYFYGF